MKLIIYVITERKFVVVDETDTNYPRSFFENHLKKKDRLKLERLDMWGGGTQIFRKFARVNEGKLRTQKKETYYENTSYL